MRQILILVLQNLTRVHFEIRSLYSSFLNLTATQSDPFNICCLFIFYLDYLLPAQFTCTSIFNDEETHVPFRLLTINPALLVVHVFVFPIARKQRVLVNLHECDQIQSIQLGWTHLFDSGGASCLSEHILHLVLLDAVADTLLVGKILLETFAPHKALAELSVAEFLRI